MRVMGTIFSPVSLGTSEQEVDDALASVQAARIRRDEHIAAGTRRANDVVVKEGVVIVVVNGSRIGIDENRPVLRVVDSPA